MTPLLSINETAKLLGVSATTLRGFVARGQIAHRRIGGSIKFTQDDVLEFVESAKQPVAPKTVEREQRVKLGPLKWVTRQSSRSQQQLASD